MIAFSYLQTRPNISLSYIVIRNNKKRFFIAKIQSSGKLFIYKQLPGGFNFDFSFSYLMILGSKIFDPMIPTDFSAFHD